MRPAQAKAGGTCRDWARVQRLVRWLVGERNRKGHGGWKPWWNASNMLCAYERVVKNEGAPGVDGLTVAELKPWLKGKRSTKPTCSGNAVGAEVEV